MKGKGPRRERETNINFSRLLTYGITFKEFASLARSRGWTPEYLAQKFRGKIDGPSEFFHRVLSGKPDWSVVIPYRSILELYWNEMSPILDENKSVRVCLCGCNQRVYGRKQYAQSYCRNKAYRNRSQTVKRGVEKANEHKGLSVTIGGYGA